MSSHEDKYKIYISKDRISKWFFFVALTLPHINPGYLTQIPMLEMIIDGWRLISFLVIILWLFIAKWKISLPVILIFIQQLYIFLVTLFHNGAIYSCMVSMFSMFSIILLYSAAFNQEERNTFISAQLFCFELVIYINFLTVILYPDSMYITYDSFFTAKKNWFLGYYNNQSQFFIPALMFAWMHKLYTRKRLRTYLLTIIIFLTALFMWSGGVLISLFCMAIIYLLFKNYTVIFNCYMYWCTHIIFLVSIPTLMMQDWFHWILSDVLNKSESLLMRIKLWARILPLIFESPIIGHGVKDAISREAESGIAFAMHAHNMELEILYQGGIINLILWIAIIMISGKIIWKCRNSLESKIIATAWAGWCVVTLVEPFMTPFLMGMFIVAYYSNSEFI